MVEAREMKNERSLRSKAGRAAGFGKRLVAWLLALLALAAACGIIDQVSNLGSNVGRMIGKGIN